MVERDREKHCGSLRSASISRYILYPLLFPISSSSFVLCYPSASLSASSLLTPSFIYPLLLHYCPALFNKSLSCVPFTSPPSFPVYLPLLSLSIPLSFHLSLFPSTVDSCCNELINWSNTAVATGRSGWGREGGV